MRARSFDKSRNSAGSRLTTGLRMTEEERQGRILKGAATGEIQRTTEKETHFTEARVQGDGIRASQRRGYNNTGQAGGTPAPL